MYVPKASSIHFFFFINILGFLIEIDSLILAKASSFLVCISNHFPLFVSLFVSLPAHMTGYINWVPSEFIFQNNLLTEQLNRILLFFRLSGTPSLVWKKLLDLHLPGFCGLGKYSSTEAESMDLLHFLQLQPLFFSLFSFFPLNVSLTTVTMRIEHLQVQHFPLIVSNWHHQWGWPNFYCLAIR